MQQENAKQVADFLKQCNIYYREEIISYEVVVNLCLRHMTEALEDKKHNVDIILHSGSKCFDVINIVFLSFLSFFHNQANPDEIIMSIKKGTTVVYGERKPQKYIFDGTEITGGKATARLLQPGQSLITFVPKQRWNLIVPFSGTANKEKGIGIGTGNEKQGTFLASALNIPRSDVPNFTTVSSIVVTSKDNAYDIMSNTAISYNGLKIKLLDLVTASYFTEGGEETRYPGNPGKLDPMLKFCCKVSTARNLLFQLEASEIVGVVVLGYDYIRRGQSELPDFLNRQSLKYVSVSSSIDVFSADNLIEEYSDARIFALTQEVCQSIEYQKRMSGFYPSEIYDQVNNIAIKEVVPIFIDGSITWQENTSFKRAIDTIRQYTMLREDIEHFIINAYSLYNTITSALFPLNSLYKYLENCDFRNILSTEASLDEMTECAKRLPDELNNSTNIVLDILRKMHNVSLFHSEKEIVLKNELSKCKSTNVAIIVQKDFYREIMLADNFYQQLSNSTKLFITTSNGFDNSLFYDAIYFVGKYDGSKFDLFKCHSTSKLIPILYNYEKGRYVHCRGMAQKRAKKINERQNKFFKSLSKGIIINEEKLYEPLQEEELWEINNIDDTIDEYIMRLNTAGTSFLRHADTALISSGSVEVYTVASFGDGRRAFFTKNYKAYVLNQNDHTVDEEKADLLSAGDSVVFTKYDSNTKDIVDDLLRKLIITGHVGDEIAIAYDDSIYWKKALKDYMEISDVNYHFISKKLYEAGVYRTEQTIGGWLNEDSHVIGPTDHKVFSTIADITQDVNLLKDSTRYYEACRKIRSVRMEILKMIAEAVMGKLSGDDRKGDMLFAAVSENIGLLAEILQIETVSDIPPQQIPNAIANRPILI